MATNPLGQLELGLQLLLSYALGTAASPALAPFVQDLANEAWTLHASRPPDAALLAQGVAQGQVAPAAAYQWAKERGFDTAQMDAMVNVANVGPGAAYGFELWRRGLIDQAGFARALKRLGLEDQWVGPLEGLRDTLLSSQELAMLQQQGFIDAARADSEGALQGVTAERQQLRFEASGLPPGIGEALQMLRRNIIGSAEFAQIVREGHTKTKYTNELLALQDQVLSAATYVRGYLKGHITQQQMYAGGALTGYKPADLDLWYLTEGRPATAHEIHIGYARGAKLPGATNELDAIATAVKQSDIRPEYTEIIQAGRFSYPSPFVLRGLAQNGDLGNTSAVEQILLEIGWKPDFAAKVAAAWTGGSTTAADPHLAKAQTQLWTTTHASYKAREITDQDATAALGSAGVPTASVPAILAVWQHERDLIRKRLSAAQIRKEWFEQVTDPTTGAPLTQAQAVARLMELGYDNADAQTLLEL